MKLFLTESCNLGCSYCYQVTQGARKSSWLMTIWTIDKALELFSQELEIYWMQSASIIPFWWEPLLNKKWFYHLVNKIHQMKDENKLPSWTKIFMPTNWILVDKEFINFLNSIKYRDDFRIDVSIDWFERSNSWRVLHDWSPAFEKTFSFCKLLKKEWIKFSINLTISKHNIDHLTEALSFLWSELHAPITFFMPVDFRPIIKKFWEKSIEIFIENYTKSLYFAINNWISLSDTWSVIESIKNSYTSWNCFLIWRSWVAIKPDWQIRSCHIDTIWKIPEPIRMIQDALPWDLSPEIVGDIMATNSLFNEVCLWCIELLNYWNNFNSRI